MTSPSGQPIRLINKTVGSAIQGSPVVRSKEYFQIRGIEQIYSILPSCADRIGNKTLKLRCNLSIGRVRKFEDAQRCFALPVQIDLPSARQIHELSKFMGSLFHPIFITDMLEKDVLGDVLGNRIQWGRTYMLRIRLLMTACAFTLLGLASASATLPAPAYVDAKAGSDSGSCTLLAPCATLNFALQQIATGGSVVFLQAGVFGPVKLTGSVSITGIDPNTHVQIVADPSVSVGCMGGAPGSCGTNSGYAVEIAAGVNDTVKVGYVVMNAGPSSGAGALLLSSGGKLQIAHDVFRGNATATGPIVALYPISVSATQSQVYFSNSDVGFNNSGANAGAVEVKPSGLNSLKLHFNHVEVHNASYGIRTDGSLLTSPSAIVATFISESEFFSFNNAAVNAFSTGGTGTVNAAFDTTRILNAAVALKANGPQSFVVLTNNTVSGNTIGIQVLNSANVNSSVNNTIFGNGTDVSGTINNQPLK
jgi:parallel beta-helix repeat protein